MARYETKAKILQLRREVSVSPAPALHSNPVVPSGRPASGVSLGQPGAPRERPLPMFRALVWCGVLLVMLGGMAIMLIALGEIARRLVDLGDRRAALVSEDG
jgi:hypothetical protein